MSNNRTYTTTTLTALLLLAAISLSACSRTINTIKGGSSKPEPTIPKQHDHNSINQLAKTEFNRFADIQIRLNIQSLRTIMLKLYKRNPAELAKTHFGRAEDMVAFVFDEAKQHGYHFKSLNQLQQKEALLLAFEPNYQGDRVLAYIVGLQTMLLKAHGGTTEFYFTQDLSPQPIYNFARNLEIAAWKLNHTKQPSGQPYLLSNSLKAEIHNLSIEREFGKMIGRTDLFAIALSEGSQRTITRVIHSVASTIFLPL